MFSKSYFIDSLPESSCERKILNTPQFNFYVEMDIVIHQYIYISQNIISEQDLLISTIIRVAASKYHRVFP